MFVTMEHYHIMGKWMFAFLRVLGLHRFGQYMLIWYANMPEETQYFLTRNNGVVVGHEHVSGHRAVLRSVCHSASALDKKAPASTSYVAGWILGMQLLDNVYRHLTRVTWNRRARQHLGFCFFGRYRRYARFCLFADRKQNVTLSVRDRAWLSLSS